MNNSETALPAGFQALEPFVASWAIPGMADRARRRDESTSEERQTFYAAAKDMAAPALDYLDRKPLDQLDACERRLTDLMLSFVHVALAVEIQGDDEARLAKFRQEMKITRTPQELSPLA
ncbi:MAG: hypothetical protein ACLQUZ_05410 [Rhizomicrobium sp.]